MNGEGRTGHGSTGIARRVVGVGRVGGVSGLVRGVGQSVTGGPLRQVAAEELGQGPVGRREPLLQPALQ